jgi:hypothetical protein
VKGERNPVLVHGPGRRRKSHFPTGFDHLVVIPAKSAGCSGSNRPRVPAENGRWFRSKSAT